MENLFKDEAKIGVFKQIQYDLLDLKPNSNEEEINQIITKIPQNYLDEKDDLMVICKLFSYYLRNTLHINKGNVIKLFEIIMKPIKAHLQNESLFFWNIFGGILSFKLWMHKEGLISMETIINRIKRSKFDQNMIEFFT